jgi:predicted nucleotidyltransferase
MERSEILSILKELNLNEDCVANIYNYGSWVYGTNSPTSDRDIMIVTRSPSQPPLIFQDDFDYFHNFQLNKLWNQYDVCVHSIENFTTLLEKNYLLAVECIFLPDEFKIKEEIDFRPIYFEKYYKPLRIKQAAFYENSTAINMYDLDDDSIYPMMRSSRSSTTSQSSKDYLFKNLFHGFRYLDFARQLIETKSINNFKSVSYVLGEMKAIRGDPTVDSNMDG